MLELLLQLHNKTIEVRVNETAGIGLTFMKTMFAPSLLISILGLIGNGIVLWFLCIRIKRNTYTVYILNLAVADFCLLLYLVVALLYVCGISVRSIITPSNNVLLFSLRLLFTSGHYTSLFLLTALSVERCLSVLCPIWYKCERPQQLSSIVCTLSWVCATLLTTAECLACTEKLYIARVPHCTASVLFFAILAFGIVFPLMILPSVALIIKMKMRSLRHQPTTVYWVILLNIVVFLVTIYPTRVMALLFYFRVIPQHEFNYYAIWNVHLLCTAMNSSANPYIYYLVGRRKNRKDRGCVKVALQRAFNDEHVAPRQDIAHGLCKLKTGSSIAPNCNTSLIMCKNHS
ncbi:proto-oncogene Mas-like [Pleurodeles waltl]|uniref:proto-oncogene Mas-like n=1 Tax=Pleurodeles waltl TaxID=8319 RepID=UPI0037099513